MYHGLSAAKMRGDDIVKPLRGTELKRFLRKCERPDLELHILLADVEDPVNVGAAFRIADAVKAASVILTGITPTPPHKLIDKVGRRKDRKVPWKYVEKPKEAIDALRDNGCQIVALELTAEAKPYQNFNFNSQVCIIVGHEDHGVTKAVLEQVDDAVYIPMYGKGASLNVSVSLGVACFQVIESVERQQNVSSPSD